jgi:hypothetical protein
MHFSTVARSALAPLTLLVGLSCAHRAVDSPDPAPGPIAAPYAASDLAVLVQAVADTERSVKAYTTAPDASAACDIATVEGCEIVRCGIPASPSPRAADAGDLRVSSPSLGQNLPLGGPLPQSIWQTGAFADPETVHLVAAGSADLAPFDIQVAVPPHVRLRTFGGCGVPGNPTACGLRDAPTLEWDPLAAVHLFVSIGPDGGGDDAALQCRFDAAPGRGRIPEAAWARWVAAVPTNGKWRAGFVVYSSTAFERATPRALTIYGRRTVAESVGFVLTP